ncbi:MAG: hypothetical protein CSA32_05665 [Desulfobulbus propionicus]|nr:MAG: hypothetical protein CSA32_05665 [Desulfobulbus propionicus]
MAAEKTKKISLVLLLVSVSAVLLWAGAAFTGALKQVNWQAGELARQYLYASGMMKPLHTLVDFYSHIKGIEYLICVTFFVAFPIFVKFINAEKRQEKVSAHHSA